jgi:hypothetical protein
VPHTRYAARQRGALCTFHGHPALVLLAPSTAMGTVSTTTYFLTAIPLLLLLLLLLYFSLRSGAVVILTSAARNGGEVRITEAERP